jgi:hypothetical protein
LPTESCGKERLPQTLGRPREKEESEPLRSQDKDESTVWRGERESVEAQVGWEAEGEETGRIRRRIWEGTGSRGTPSGVKVGEGKTESGMTG